MRFTSTPSSRRVGVRSVGAARRFRARLVASAIVAFVLTTPLAVVGGPAAASSRLSVTTTARAAASWDVATADGPHGADRPNYDYAIEPGERIDDAVVVTNTGDSAVVLDLYAADAFTTDAGALDLRTESHPATGVGSWLTLSTSSLALEPGEATEVPFTVTVPDTAAGEYIGGIVTAVPADGDAVEHRAAVRVRLHVGASFAPSLEVADVSVDYVGPVVGDGNATVRYVVRNTGDTVLAAEQSVSLSGPFDLGRVHVDDAPNVPELLPGESWVVTVPVDGIAPMGLLTASVTAVPLYTDPAGSTGPLDAVEQSGTGAAAPWIVVVAALAVVAVLVAVIVARRARAQRRQRDEQQTVSQ